MPKSKSSRFARKKKVVYDRVRFTLPEIFGDDAEFNLPSARQVPQGVQRRLNSDPEAMLSWIVENIDGEDAEDQIDAIDSIYGDEVKQFVEAWQKASKVDLGKSKS